MKILYITSDNPAVDAILNGMKEGELEGLPAFYYSFKKLVEKGHSVDMLLVSDKDHKVISSRYFSEKNLIMVKARQEGISGKFEYLFQVAGSTRKLLKKRHYDFVYGMSEGAYPGVRLAYRMGIPSALRLFGTREMANDLEKIPGKAAKYLRAIKDYPYITLSIHGRMTFLLITNDGSRADQLYEIMDIQDKHYSFFFWRTGVYIPNEQPELSLSEKDQYPNNYSTMHLSHIGRITDIKRQDRSVRILAELHKRGYPMHLHFIGSTSGQEMLETIQMLAREYGIEDYVHVEGGKSQSMCRKYGRNSLATLLVANLNCGNVFYEVMSEGCALLTNNNHSVDEFIEDGVNCLVYEEDDYGQAADKIISLLKDPEKNRYIRRGAYLTAKEKFLSLDRRFDMEAALVEAAATGHDLSQYPTVL